MSDLVAFLTARLDEDEAALLGTDAAGWRRTAVTVEQRALRVSIEMVRRFIREHSTDDATLRGFAREYAEHPDFREEWRA